MAPYIFDYFVTNKKETLIAYCLQQKYLEKSLFILMGMLEIFKCRISEMCDIFHRNNDFYANIGKQDSAFCLIIII